MTEFQQEPAEQVRTWLADQIRDRVVGPNAEDRTNELFNAPGERWFDDNAPIRTVHLDASMFIGGIRALLLQSLHPLAMTGVAQHSDYKNDPWGRLQRTADFLATTTFGPAEAADQAIATVTAIHDRVTGTTADGVDYRANDPHLLAWVHVAEVDSFLRAHDRYGESPLEGADRDRYVAESGSIAARLGADPVPTTEQGVADLLNDFRSELRATPEAKEAARYLLIDPPLPASSKPA
ncbi:MAG: oxygenase MpaB family protein, partial [Ilumatobacteraceae bacterium]